MSRDMQPLYDSLTQAEESLSPPAAKDLRTDSAVEAQPAVGRRWRAAAIGVSCVLAVGLLASRSCLLSSRCNQSRSAAVVPDVPMHSSAFLGLDERRPKEKPEEPTLQHFNLLPKAKELRQVASDPGTSMQKAIQTLYYLYAGTAWSILANASANETYRSLNFGFPDFRSEYWITTFNVGDEAVFKGSFPAWAVYAALTLYDTNGLPLQSVNLKDKGFEPGKHFEYKFSKMPDRSEYAVLFRAYRHRHVVFKDQDKIKVEVNGEMLEASPTAVAAECGKTVEPILQEVRARTLSAPKIFNEQMSRPRTDDLQDVWANPDAVDLVTTPDEEKSKDWCFKFEGKLPKQEDWRVFYGFMAVDLSTTATVDSIFDEEMCSRGQWGPCWDTEYTVFASRSRDGCKASGYLESNPFHHLLQFGNTSRVAKPQLILRIINTNSTTELNRLNDEAKDSLVNWTDVKSILGDSFPSLTVS